MYKWPEINGLRDPFKGRRGDLQQDVEHVTAWITWTLDMEAHPLKRYDQTPPKYTIQRPFTSGEQKISHFQKKKQPYRVHVWYIYLPSTFQGVPIKTLKDD